MRTMRMSKVIELSDEQYRIIERAAATRSQTPDAFLAQLIEELRDRDRDPRYYETDDWLRHLGMSDEAMRRIDAEIKAEAETRRPPPVSQVRRYDILAGTESGDVSGSPRPGCTSSLAAGGTALSRR